MLQTILACFCLVGALATEPGAELRVTQNGLNYAKNIGIEIIGTELQKVALPDISGTESILKYTFSDIKIPVFDISPENAGIIPVAGKGLTLSANSISTTLSMNWNVTLDLGLIHIHKSGGVVAKATSTSFNLEIDMTSTSEGKMAISTKNCQAKVDHLSVHITGDVIDEIANILDPIIDAVVKSQINSAVCSQIDTLVKTNLTEALNKIPVKGSILLNFWIDYSLTSPPVFTSDYAQLDLKGELYMVGHENIPVVAPVPAQFDSPAGAMISVAMTDFVFNAITYTIQSSGLLTLPLSPGLLSKLLGPSVIPYFDTSCDAPQICVGSLIPQIGEKFPNSSTTIQFTTLMAPTIHTDKTGIKLNLNATFAVSVDSDTSGVPVVTIQVSQDIHFTDFKLDNNNGTLIFKGSVKVGNYTLEITQKSDSSITQQEMEHVLKVVTQSIINNQLNKALEAGVAIPMNIPYVDLFGTQFDYYDSTLVFSSKVHYKGGLPLP